MIFNISSSILSSLFFSFPINLFVFLVLMVSNFFYLISLVQRSRLDSWMRDSAAKFVKVHNTKSPFPQTKRVIQAWFHIKRNFDASKTEEPKNYSLFKEELCSLVGGKGLLLGCFILGEVVPLIGNQWWTQNKIVLFGDVNRKKGKTNETAKLHPNFFVHH